jgi:CpeT protein
MVFERQESRFLGRVEGDQCLIPKNGCQTYLVSEVEVTASTWSSLDRGFDVNTHQQVWGSDHGALQFTKSQDFSRELSEA